MQREGMFYQTASDHAVQCRLCPHRCKIKLGGQGICRVRSNQAGTLIASNYGQVAALALDPIEKKPLYHFYPGSLILSAGTFGCNLACSFCQNFVLAHHNPDTRFIPPSTMVSLADNSREQGSIGLAFTYNEPTVWYEYIWDSAQLLKEHGHKVVLITNGYIETQPLKQLLPLIDAVNIDIKAFQNDFYKRLCKGSLKPVLETVERAVQSTHVEITTLIIPGENDQLEDIATLAKWLSSLHREIPLHLSGYHPAYNCQRPATPEETLLRARQTAQVYLPFVYLGNTLADNNTLCLNCGTPLIQRNCYRTELDSYFHGSCKSCGAVIDYIVA